MSIGYGDLAQRMQQHLSPRTELWGLRRSPITQLEKKYTIQADIRQLKSLPEAEQIIVTLTPDDDYASTYVKGMQNIVKCLEKHDRPARLIFVSSTRVYPQKAGEWVDEESPTQAWGERAQALLEAEQLCRDYAHACIVRFSGLYTGSAPHYLKKYRNTEAGCYYTNRIHREDAARFLAHIVQKKTDIPLFLASDHLPAQRQDILIWWGWQQERIEAAPQGKRCQSKRISQTGFKFTYPDFKTAYRAALQDAD